MGTVIHEDTLISSASDNMERIKKEEEYHEYIVDHINNVQTAFAKLMLPLLDHTNISSVVSDDEIYAAINQLKDDIKNHDGSKFSDAEFDGYRAKWHPTARENMGDEEYKIRMRERYEDCWEHHYKSNDHHPEYWYDFQTQTASDMSLVAILHMICDWEGMSIKFKQNTLDWYENDKGGKAEKDKMMTSRTKEILNDFLYNILFV